MWIKLINGSLMLFMAFFTSAYTQPAKTSLADATDDVKEIQRSMQEIERAFVSRDPGPFEKLFLDGYVNIRGKIAYNAREQLLAMVRWDAATLKAGKKLNFETLSYESDGPLIHMYGDVAVITVLKKNLWRYMESKCLSQYQTTELWVKTESQWKLAVGHMSTIQCNPMPWQPPHPAVAEIRTQTKPSKYLSPETETSVRETISKVNDAASKAESGLEFFVPDFMATDLSNNVTPDRTSLLAALRTPTGRGNERYRDDEAFLSYGNAVAYFFRIRSIAKTADAKPDPPINYSVIFVKQGGAWKIASSHASTIQD